jgi:CBS domain-containing protein
LLLLNKELISTSLPFLSLTDKVGRALEIMNEDHVMHLPVVEDEKYVGLVSEDDLLNADESLALKEIQPYFSQLSVHDNGHFFEAVQMANENGLSVVPVTDKDKGWIGSITNVDLLKYLAHTTGVDIPGGIIVLELDQKNLSFSEICKLVETNDAQITQLNTTYNTANGIIYVTLKINKFEISDIVATFQRYEYQVKYYFGEELYENELKSNYDHLMNYLSI